jgi:hypothetical protein
MESATQRLSSRNAVLFAFWFALGLASVRIAAATPVPGYVEHWSGISGAGWGGGDFYVNPGAGGQQGASDGFLQITTPGPSPFSSTKLGTTNADAKYTGDWTAAGITQVKFWLDDVGNPEPLEMHFAIGSDINLWQYDTGFIPPANSWAQFTVDLTSSTGWTHTIAGDPGGTFASALANVARILIRHDHAPFTQAPDEISADVGLDELMLVGGGNTGVPVGGPAVARPVQMAVPYPNPSWGPVVLSIESFDGSPIRIEVVDAAGRLVRHARLESGAAGPRLWTWDGLTDAGATAPPGYYRARAIGAAGGTSRALVRLGD